MYNRKIYYQKDYRFIPFAAPFLLGALTGGVAVGVTRPRPYYPVGYSYYYQY